MKDDTFPSWLQRQAGREDSIGTLARWARGGIPGTVPGCLDAFPWVESRVINRAWVEYRHALNGQVDLGVIP